MSKTILITCVLSGILVGMLFSIFLSFSIPAKNIQYILEKSCVNTNPKSIEIKYLGKHISLKCENGEVHNYNLLAGNAGN